MEEGLTRREMKLEPGLQKTWAHFFLQFENEKCE